MSDRTAPTIPKWPFFLGDVLLLLVAWFIFQKTTFPAGFWPIGLVVLAVAGGAWLSVTPFLREHQAELKLIESGKLADTVGQIQNLENIAGHISTATAQWQTVQEHSARTVAAANAITGRMAAEAKGFTEFIQKANDSEKAHLRLETEKLRRTQNDWLEIVVRMLDHIFALHRAGVRSGQPALLEQLTRFQHACRDTARVVGLVAVETQVDDPFDPQAHQLPDPQAAVPAEARVAEIFAPGYTFQGQLLRHAVVTIKEPGAATAQNLESEPVAARTNEPVSIEPVSPPSGEVAPEQAQSKLF